MNSSTKTGLIVGGAILAGGAVGTGIALALRKPAASKTPAPQPPSPVPSPVWQIANLQVQASASAYALTLTKTIYSDALLILPQGLMSFTLQVLATNISTTNQTSYFKGRLVAHGTGAVVMQLQQLRGFYPIPPQQTVTCLLTPAQGQQALAVQMLPTGYVDLQLDALSANGSVVQSFTFPNVLQFENATGIQGVGASAACAAKILAGPFWALAGGTQPVGGSTATPQQQALSAARTTMGVLQMTTTCPLQVLQVYAQNQPSLIGYVVAQGSPTAAMLRYNAPTYLPV